MCLDLWGNVIFSQMHQNTLFIYCLASSERIGLVGNHNIKYIFRYLILITNDSHQCYSIILRRLVSGVRATSLADIPAVSISMALSRCSNVIPGRRGMAFDMIFKDFFLPVFVLTIRKLPNCVLCPICCVHTARDFHES